MFVYLLHCSVMPYSRIFRLKDMGQHLFGRKLCTAQGKPIITCMLMTDNFVYRSIDSIITLHFVSRETENIIFQEIYQFI